MTWGWDAAQADDAAWFCGRDDEVDELVARVGAGRFVAVFGPSRSGESSLLRAGLAPRLTAGGPVVLLTPGHDPLGECAAHLARLVGATAGAVRADLAADRLNLHRLVRQALVDRPAEAEPALVVDQFEELFTLCGDERVRHAGEVAADTTDLVVISSLNEGSGGTGVSPDGAFAATRGRDATTHLWDLTDPRRPRRGGILPGANALFTFGGDGALVATPDRRRRSGSPSTPPGAAAFAADRLLVTG
ncbi:hypothetical protein [Saccharothrix xinjiangensis]|uniref:Novel STAND NTPase 1 domain-containing protein n=1 Tax=Saccharothrix xinjiangensis TaxID=204798 RepID=A0ABV9Y6F2_9PSEU